MMSFTVETLIAVAQEYAGPKAKEWVKKVQARPAYQRVRSVRPNISSFCPTDNGIIGINQGRGLQIPLRGAIIYPEKS
jgi:hypothetical protein